MRGTVLNSDSYFLLKPLNRRIERKPVDFTDKVTITWELVVPTETGLDMECYWLSTDCSSWDLNLQPMIHPVVVQWLVWSDLYLCLGYDICSSDVRKHYAQR